MHLIFILADFIKSLMKYFSNYVIFSESSLINSRNLLQKQLHFSFFSCKNRICHHKFELNARNNDWTNKRSQYIHQNLCDFPNITLAGSELAIVAKRHLESMYHNLDCRQWNLYVHVNIVNPFRVPNCCLVSDYYHYWIWKSDQLHNSKKTLIKANSCN